MKISEAIKKLEELKGRFGDLEIGGGYVHDDTPLRKITVTDADGVEVIGPLTDGRPKPLGVFMES